MFVSVASALFWSKPLTDFEKQLARGRGGEGQGTHSADSHPAANTQLTGEAAEARVIETTSVCIRWPEPDRLLGR